ncbi:hypothetical protein AB0K51_18580 [Kitasatospora sp. NPDC049285]|uniref:hypothetical protein n=1 Tax=Kitasatospora sp. NPDC049285 TaxID=3157096 RepID=UPI003418D667
MRSGLVKLGAWTAATGAAVALSWLGVHAVLADTVFDEPVAVPLPTAGTAQTRDAPPPTLAPATSAAADATTAAPSPDPDPDPTPSAPSRTPAVKRSPSPTTSVHSYLVPGGRVALDLRATEAELVSATPETGWGMQVWHGDQWMRIDFSKDGRTSSVFVTWNGHPPDVQTVPG